MLSPGSRIILKGKTFDTSDCKEGDKMRVDGCFIRQVTRGYDIFVNANEEFSIEPLSGEQVRRILADNMLLAASKEILNAVIKPKIENFPMQKRQVQGPPRLPTSVDINKYKRFLSNYTPSKIEDKLNDRIVGQEGLTKLVADFLYYHALRQIKPELPPRPMLISGPSGSGKTEVWRATKTIFEGTFQINIVDGASMTGEGWKGDNKLSSHIDREIANGGILIIDEFDKLAKPAYESNGSNIAAEIQAEFLKLLEGELTKKEDKKLMAEMFKAGLNPLPGETKIDTKKMGVVLIGAFEDIKSKRQSRVGFGNQDILSSNDKNITDEEYIEFGVLPELIGRVAIKVTTNQLTDDEYIQIIHNPHSRVSTIINILKEFGVDPSRLLNDDEMKGLIQRSRSNKTGVRWVSAQIENKMLASIRDGGIGELMITDPEQQTLQPINEQSKIGNEAVNGNDKEDEFFF